jgi:hypothetical protein
MTVIISLKGLYLKGNTSVFCEVEITVHHQRSDALPHSAPSQKWCPLNVSGDTEQKITFYLTSLVFKELNGTDWDFIYNAAVVHFPMVSSAMASLYTLLPLLGTGRQPIHIRRYHLTLLSPPPRIYYYLESYIFQDIVIP